MNISNFEFKAKVEEIESFENKLLQLNPIFKGIDNQIDTYFNSTIGRLKLREGNIENSLIQYARQDIADLKLSDIVLYKHEPNPALKQILSQQLGIKIVVKKTRKIYFINNIKFHFDRVESLGYFIEVEAISTNNQFTVQQLQQQCNYYFSFFNLTQEKLIDKSYSDLLLQQL